MQRLVIGPYSGAYRARSLWLSLLIVLSLTAACANPPEDDDASGDDDASVADSPPVEDDDTATTPPGTPATTPDTPATPPDTPTTPPDTPTTPADSPTPSESPEPGRSVLELSQTTLTFTVEAGQEELRTVTVSNIGNVEASVESALVSGEGFRLTEASSQLLPALLAPSDELELEVAFAPLVVEDVEGELELLTTALLTPRLYVTLIGIVPRCPNDPDNDLDGDALCADQDNCPDVSNPDQLDSDADGAGDACDPCPFDTADDRDDDEVCGDVDLCPDAADPDQADLDGDGTGDACDACPADPLDDTDGDGVCGDVDLCPDAADPDQADLDGDGTGDACDACPLDAADDLDDDGVCGDVDLCPDVADPDQADLDGDGTGDACDACPADELDDLDGDGHCGDVDNCPTVANPGQGDIDGNGVGDACSSEVCDGIDNDANGTIDDGFADGDQDGRADCVDRCPADARNDVDGDGVCGDVDSCPDTANPDQGDVDGDGEGDACDACPGDARNDEDGDGVCGDRDNCPETANDGQADSDRDGRGDACDVEECDALDNDGDGRIDEGFDDGDADGRADCVDPCPADPNDDADEDGVCGDVDNCPDAANPGQGDHDGDARGDVCDLCPADAANDADGDGVCGDEDNCPDNENGDQADDDNDGTGDRCDACPADARNDVDGDGVCGDRDNCPEGKNRDQSDVDMDGTGDVCDACPADAHNDADDDGVCGGEDNCPTAANAGQADTDVDGVGDACDLEECDALDNDGDGAIDEDFVDTDHDAKADCVDRDDDDDRVEDSADPDPLDPQVCGDTDEDSCDDCAVAGHSAPGNDGADADGDGLCDAGDNPDGSSQLEAGLSCGAILDQGFSTGDGLYWVDPDGGSSSNAFQVWCDMTTDGGGWMLVGKLGQSASRVDDFSLDRDVNSLLNDTPPTTSQYAHYSMSRFNGFGSSWVIRSRVDANNNATHYQTTFFQPKQGGTCSPKEAGSNWRNTETRLQLVYLNRSSTTGSNNTTWLAVDRFDDVSAGNPSMYFLGSRRVDLGGQCLSAASANGQTLACHSPAGLVSNESGQIGTYTAAFGMQDGVSHSWGRRATYWIRDSSSGRSGQSFLNPASSCRTLYEAGKRTSGYYWVDPDGGSTANAFSAYCDMTTDGGGWTMGVNIASDLGPIDLFTYNNRSSDALNTNYGINLVGMGLSKATEYRLTCVESSDGSSRKMFIKGLNPLEPIFRASGTITKTDLVCSLSADFSSAFTGVSCIFGGHDDENHTYYGNTAWDMDWALYKLSGAYTLRHCANRGNGYFNKGALWFR